MGVYGFLLRTNLEHLNLFDISGARASQRPRSEWKVVIDGVEGFAAYLTPVHEYSYNRILLGDALDVLQAIPSRSYELVLAIDILEHFDRQNGDRFIVECLRICSKACLISTPKDYIEQIVEANPLEDHRSHWTKADLSDRGLGHVIDDAVSWIAVASIA